MPVHLLTIAFVLAALIWVIILLARNHKRWLERQTPTGAWQSSVGPAKITLQFEGGPREGTYKQLSESEGKSIKEFGHWSASANNLQMTIMATDVQSHPRFGVDTAYNISYVGPTSIKVDGPERLGIIYQKVTAGADLNSDGHS